jgi:MFS family permease
MTVALRHASVRWYLLSVAWFGLGTGIFDVLFNLHLLKMGFTSNQIGTLFLVILIVMAAGAIPTGIIADRLGRRWFLIGGSLVFGLTMLVLPFVSTFASMAMLLAVNAIGGIMMMTNESPTIAGEVESDSKTGLFSAIFGTYLITSASGALVAGFLPRVLPTGALSEYQYPLVIAGVLTTLIGVTRWLIRFKPESVKPPRESRRTILVPRPAMLSVGLIALLVGGSAVLAMRLLNVVLAQRYGMTAAQIGIITVVEQGVSFLGVSIAPFVTKRFPERLSASVALAATFPLHVLCGFAPTIGLFLAPFLGRQTLHYFQMPLLDSIAMSSVAPAERATMSSYRQVGFFLGSAILAKVDGALLANGRYGTAFTVSGVLALSAAVAYVLLRGHSADAGADSELLSVAVAEG